MTWRIYLHCSSSLERNWIFALSGQYINFDEVTYSCIITWNNKYCIMNSSFPKSKIFDKISQLAELPFSYWMSKQLEDVTKLFVSKSLVTMTSNVLPLHLKQTLLPIIWIFFEIEGYGIESRLPFKIFSTLLIHLFFSKWVYSRLELEFGHNH